MPSNLPGGNPIPPKDSRPVILVHPPQARSCEPAPGLLVLAHHLAAAGRTVELVDANLAVLEQLFAPESLQRMAAEVGDGGSSAAATSARRCVNHVPAALTTLRERDVYRDPNRYRAAADTLGEGFRVATRARGVRLTPSDLVAPDLSPLSGRDLLCAFTEPERSGLAPELRVVAQRILDQSPQLVGFSATYLSQTLPAAALAGLLRQAGYRGLLALGGGVVTSWVSHLSPGSDVFRVWDALVAGPGEDALLALCEGSGTGAPGLLAPVLAAWNPPRAETQATITAHPWLHGLPWGRYLAPGPILPLATCRGCYWRRCTYCPEAAQDRQRFRPHRAQLIRAIITRARDEFGIHRVHFTDDAIPPATLRGLSRLLQGEGISWYGFVRPEPALLDPSLAEDLVRSGCAMLQVGIESASQHVLDRLGKGTRAVDAAPILANLASVGIRTYVYLLFGVPGERPADRDATLAWAGRTAGDITFCNLALMNVPRQSAPDRGRRGGRELSLYAGMEPGDPFGRRAARQALAEARSQPALQPILRRTPPGFGANHAAWVPLKG